MIALFDIGNTRIKWARLAHNKTQHPESAGLLDVGAENHAGHTLDEMAALYWSGWSQPEQILVSTVATGDHWRQWQGWCRRYWQRTPVRVISTAEGFGIRNAYAQAEELGSDRWTAMVGAHHLLHSETCIIDAGTAMTVDFLNAAGQHLGGYIIPGLELMQRSLVQGTGAIQLSSGLFFTETGLGEGMDINVAPGISTTECIEHGLMMAATSLIEESCKKMEIRTGKPFCRLLTGGHAGLLASSLGAGPGARVQLEPHLVLFGLARMAANNYPLTSTI